MDEQFLALVSDYLILKESLSPSRNHYNLAQKLVPLKLYSSSLLKTKFEHGVFYLRVGPWSLVHFFVPPDFIIWNTTPLCFYCNFWLPSPFLKQILWRTRRKRALYTYINNFKISLIYAPKLLHEQTSSFISRFFYFNKS